MHATKLLLSDPELCKVVHGTFNFNYDYVLEHTRVQTLM